MKHLWGTPYKYITKRLDEDSLLNISRAVSNEAKDREAVESLMKSEGLKVRPGK